MKDAASDQRRYRSDCPLASALDLLGDRWSLLVVRGLFTGASRYGDFLKAQEGIATNILADRLKRLEETRIIDKVESDGAPRYHLTRRGAELLPVLQALARWGHTHIPGRWQPPEWFMKAQPSDFYGGPQKAGK